MIVGTTKTLLKHMAAAGDFTADVVATSVKAFDDLKRCLPSKLRSIDSHFLTSFRHAKVFPFTRSANRQAIDLQHFVTIFSLFIFERIFPAGHPKLVAWSKYVTCVTTYCSYDVQEWEIAAAEGLYIDFIAEWKALYDVSFPSNFHHFRHLGDNIRRFGKL